MQQKTLVEKFLEEIDDPLLEKLIKSYQQNRAKDQNEKVETLVAQLQAEFKERCHADS